MQKLEEKTLHDWRDLEQYGVHVLTGEACGIGIRLLCDLDPDGIALMEEFLSTTIQRGNNWNHLSEKDWASIMLPRTMFQQLASFCLLREGYECAVTVNANYRDNEGGYSAFFVKGYLTVDDFTEVRETFNRLYPRKWHIWIRSGTAKAGLRNQHVFTGRVT